VGLVDPPFYSFNLSIHAQSYRLIAPYTKIALFGAYGQIVERILVALLSNTRYTFIVTAFIPPETKTQQSSHANVVVKTFNTGKATHESVAKDPKGIEAIVGALNGPALKAQSRVQDAAVDAGVKRLYASEYDFHRVYRKSKDPTGYNHPAWNMKAE
jgi:hypothetical protein